MPQRFGTRHGKNREQTRQIIFKTAYELLEEKGYNKFTMRELASRAGVGLGTIFQHFKDKTTLLTAIYEHEFYPFVKEVFDSLPPTDIKAQLIFMAEKFYRYYAENPQISMIMVKELYLDVKQSPTVDQTFQDDLSKISALFGAAIQRGEIDPQTNVQDATIMWWAYYGCVLLDGLQSPRFDADRQVAVFKRLMNQHFKGIENRS